MTTNCFRVSGGGGIGYGRSPGASPTRDRRPAGARFLQRRSPTPVVPRWDRNLQLAYVRRSRHTMVDADVRCTSTTASRAVQHVVRDQHLDVRPATMLHRQAGTAPAAPIEYRLEECTEHIRSSLPDRPSITRRRDRIRQSPTNPTPQHRISAHLTDTASTPSRRATGTSTGAGSRPSHEARTRSSRPGRPGIRISFGTGSSGIRTQHRPRWPASGSTCLRRRGTAEPAGMAPQQDCVARPRARRTRHPLRSRAKYGNVSNVCSRPALRESRFYGQAVSM